MNDHLAIRVNDEYMTLPADYGIDIEDVNPYFNDHESFAYETTIPMEGNRKLLKNMDDRKSDIRAVELEHSPMQIIAEGMPFRSGRLQISEEQELDTDISFSMVSTVRSLTDMITDLNCWDIPLKDKIQIGEMIGNVFAEFQYRYDVEVGYRGKKKTKYYKDNEMQFQTVANAFELQALGFSFPGICNVKNENTQEAAKGKVGRPDIKEHFINVSDSYPQRPYCNARVCYTHYEKEEDGTSGDKVSTKDAYDPYYVLEADRSQSGLCFYVLYFLDCLFHYLNLSYSNKNLLGVGDLSRLAFFTTHHKYDLERKFANKPSSQFDFTSVGSINKWLSSRNTGASLELTYNKTKEVTSAIVDGKLYTVGQKVDGVEIVSARFIPKDPVMNIKANIMNMYANSKNFPDASVSSILDSLWASFGIKFMLDYESQSVTPRLIRDLYRSEEEPVKLKCQVISANKVVEKITGFRMKYDAESSSKEKSDIIRSGQKDYDTDYDYTDYSKVDSSKTYLEILKKQSSSDLTCYIDVNTGNAYRLKVNADAETVNELKPALFEVGAYKGVEIGDVSVENEDFIIELSSEFQPVIFNDVNAKNQRDVGSNNSYNFKDSETGTTHTISGINSDKKGSILAPFIDEDMWHENTEAYLDYLVGSDHADFIVRGHLKTDESYDPTSTEDGNSPLQAYDWGLSIAIMRGGGADSQIERYDYNYDGFGNSKWRMTIGQYAMSSDSIDNWAREYDYNGIAPGIGDDERFSLKIRAYKEVDGKILCNDDIRDSQGNIVTKVRSRGLFDTFMSEHAHFMLNRKRYTIRLLCEVSELMDIPNNWHCRYNIGGYIGWINTVKTHITVEKGIELVEIDFYSI